MNAHELNENGKIINTIEVNDLNFPGKILVDASIGGSIGDSVIDGVLIPYEPPLTPTPVPEKVTRKQARLALLAAGYFGQVESSIESMQEPQRTQARIIWNDSDEYHRNNPFVAQMASALGLIDSDVDNLFIAAAAIV